MGDARFGWVLLLGFGATALNACSDDADSRDDEPRNRAGQAGAGQSGSAGASTDGRAGQGGMGGAAGTSPSAAGNSGSGGNPGASGAGGSSTSTYRAIVDACASYCRGAAALPCVQELACVSACVDIVDVGYAECAPDAVALARCWDEVPEASLICTPGGLQRPLVCGDEEQALSDCKWAYTPEQPLELECARLCARKEQACELDYCVDECIDRYERDVANCGGTARISAYFDCVIAEPLDAWECMGGSAHLTTRTCRVPSC